MYTVFQKTPIDPFLFLNNSVRHQPIFNKICYARSWVNTLQICFYFCQPRLKTVTTLPCEIRNSYFSSLQQWGRCQKYHWLNMFNAVTEHVHKKLSQNNTVRNDLLVHKHGHRVSFAIGQLIHLLHSAGSQPTYVLINLCYVLAFDRPVAAPLPKCGNQPDQDPIYWLSVSGLVNLGVWWSSSTFWSTRWAGTLSCWKMWTLSAMLRMAGSDGSLSRVDNMALSICVPGFTKTYTWARKS